MKSLVLFRLTRTILLLSGLTLTGGPLLWQIEELRNWTNPEGPGYQSMFLTHGGTRLVTIWPGGTLVIPMEELLARQYDLQLLFRPATFNSFAVQAAEAELVLLVSPGGGGSGTPGAGGGGTGTPGTGGTGGGGP